MNYIFGVQQWEDETGIATETTANWSVHKVIPMVSPNEATGIRTIYVAQWGISSDDNNVTEWTFDVINGWVGEAIVTDGSRNDCLTALKAGGIDIINSVITEEDYDDMNAILTG